MLWLMVLVLLIVWLLSFSGKYNFGGFEWLILAAAFVLLVVQFVAGSRTER